MTGQKAYGYAFVIALPEEVDERLRRWAAATPDASADTAGGHVTLARLTGSLDPLDLLPVFRNTCATVHAFDVALCKPAREEYWDKPGLEIVMLVGSHPKDVEGLLSLRERLVNAAISASDIRLQEGDAYTPHITLTTGLPPERARALEAAAGALGLRFTAREVVFWTAGEDGDPPWQARDRVFLK